MTCCQYYGDFLGILMPDSLVCSSNFSPLRIPNDPSNRPPNHLDIDRPCRVMWSASVTRSQVLYLRVCWGAVMSLCSRYINIHVEWKEIHSLDTFDTHVPVFCSCLHIYKKAQSMQMLRRQAEEGVDSMVGWMATQHAFGEGIWC